MENNWQDEFDKNLKAVIAYAVSGNLQTEAGQWEVSNFKYSIETLKSEWEKASFELGVREVVKEIGTWKIVEAPKDVERLDKQNAFMVGQMNMLMRVYHLKKKFNL